MLVVLEAQHRLIRDSDATEKAQLGALLAHLRQGTTSSLTGLETVVMLRHLRVQRDKIGRDLMALEERRLRGGFNGELDAAHRTLDAEATILDDVIRRLWDMMAV